MRRSRCSPGKRSRRSAALIERAELRISCAADRQSSRICSDSSNRVQCQRERLGVHLRWKTEIRRQAEFWSVGYAMQPTRDDMLAEHPRGEVAGSTGHQYMLQAEPADVDRQRGAHEIRKSQRMLREEL